MSNSLKKLKQYQYTWLYLVIIIEIIACALTIFITMCARKTQYIKYEIGLFVITTLPFVCIMYLTREKRKISQQIDEFVNDNKLLQKRKEKTSDNREIEIIDYYPEIYWSKDKKDKYLSIKIRLDGNPCAQRFEEKTIEKALADKFKAVCDGKITEPGYVTYKFKQNTDERIIIKSSKDIPQTEETEIQFAKDIRWNWEKQPHILITGITGSGKTQLCMYIMTCLIRAGARLIYCDPKNDDTVSSFMSKHPSITYVTEENEIARVVRETEEEVICRKRESEENGISGMHYTPIFLFFDEMIAYKKLASPSNYTTTMKRMAVIIVSGRGKQVYGGIMLQRADVEFIDGAIRDNLMCRIAMGENTETANAMVFGSEYGKIKKYKHGTGSGVIYRIGEDTMPKEFFAPYIYENALDDV